MVRTKTILLPLVPYPLPLKTKQLWQKKKLKKTQPSTPTLRN